MKKTVVYILIVVAFLLGSCKSKKTMTEGEKATSTSHLIELIQQVQPSFSTMNANSVKVNVNMNGQTYNSPASIKIITDSVIVLAVYPFLGIEAFSLELYPDKWILYDKINMKYVTDNYQFFSYRYGLNISYKDLQAIFSAQLFESGGGEVDYKNYKFTSLGEGRNEIMFDNKQVTQTSRTDIFNLVENVSLQGKSKNYLLTVQYHNYTVSKGKAVMYPSDIRINTVVDNTTSISLNMNIQKVSFDGEVKLSLSRPERYERTTIDQIFTK